MTLGGLFSGIGGFELAAQWAGITPIWSNEIDPFCCKVLRKNFNHDIIEADIRDCGTGRKYELAPVDIICGGFPCQPFSSAGQRKGKADDRYLWPEMLRTIREVKPAWVVGENVTGILSMDSGAVFEQICASLEDEGYAVETFIIPACGIGAPHRRDRVWIVANANDILQRRQTERGEFPGKAKAAKGSKQWEGRDELFRQRDGTMLGNGFENSPLADPTGQDDRRHPREQNCRSTQQFRNSFEQGITPNATVIGRENRVSRNEQRREASEYRNIFKVEHWLQAATRICGIFNGFSRGIHKNRLNHGDKMDGPKKGTKINSIPRWDDVRNMSISREHGATPPGSHQEAGFGSDSLQGMSRKGGSENWEAAEKEKEKLQGLRENVHAQPFTETQHLQQGVSIGNRESERNEAMGQSKDRTNRLKALGNAIVPQVAQIIFESILQLENQ